MTRACPLVIAVIVRRREELKVTQTRSTYIFLSLSDWPELRCFPKAEVWRMQRIEHHVTSKSARTQSSASWLSYILWPNGIALTFEHIGMPTSLTSRWQWSPRTRWLCVANTKHLNYLKRWFQETFDDTSQSFLLRRMRKYWNSHSVWLGRFESWQVASRRRKPSGLPVPQHWLVTSKLI